MMFYENLKMAFVSLRNAKLRSFLTMLGIIIGVAAVVSILAIGAGVKKAVQDQITGVINASAVTVATGKLDLKGGRGANPGAAALGPSTLTAKDVDSIEKLKNVKAVAPLSIISSPITGNGVPINNEITLAATPDFTETQTFTFAGGRFFNDNEMSQPVAVLGGAAAKDLFGDANALNKTIVIKNTRITVIGVLKTSDTSGFSFGPSLDNAVYLPRDFTAKLTNIETLPIQRILVQVNNVANVNSVADAIKSTLLASHDDQEDFTVLRQQDILKTIDTILSLLTTFIVAIASISLLVGGIGIMNIMLVSVTERTREIGLRKAIGASSATVLSQFLIEAMVLSLFGGALGIAAAIGLATVAGQLANITPVFTPNSIALAVGVSAAVGIIFGIAPAIKAARKRPIQALKAE